MPPADRASLSKALDAYDKGDAKAAEPTLRELSRRYPRSYQINEALGSLYTELNDAQKALPYLQKATAEAPREPLAHANLGVALSKLNRTPEALIEFEAAAKLDPANPENQSSLGQALMLIGHQAEAAQAFERAASLKPNDLDLTYNWALALYESNAAKQAAAVLENIPPPRRTDQLNALAGEIVEHLGNFQQALLHFEAAAQQSPTDANLYAVVVELLRHWNWPEAIRVAKYAEARYPASSHFALAQGISYYANNQYPEAVQVFSGLLAKDPDAAPIADLLGRSCSLLPEGQDPGCLAMYSYAERHPGNAVTATYTAVAILHGPPGTQDLDKAENLLQGAIAAQPGYAEAYLQLGIVEQIRQHWKESAAALERSIALRPTSAEAHYRLSRAYAHLGRRTEAEQQVALNQTYSQQAKDSLNARMQEVMKFVLDPK